ncbi:hypothetical protein DLAC_03638 [Tieghemostelium lacteum]|uniref:Clu domain-containing protein n=1 Tax=Tieghemostelium lacteum TaxID=361077 RepID=A0A152A0G8_TIELA|nr:hypothetical protein DLAC_03638 [Tieghemostelium lacteum]|eukprot:KYQ99698.1 hypothetical protein DLAC_03638 [Tieghemostelium lacteum]
MDLYGISYSSPESQDPYNPTGSEHTTSSGASTSSGYNPHTIVYSTSNSESETENVRNIYSLETDGNAPFISEEEQENSWSDLFVCGLKNIEDSDLSKEITHWNELFQQILDMDESEERSKKLATIANDFVYCADTFGKIIISELYLPVEKKTIKPVDIGGVAGGLKFKIQDIMFKFVIDTEIREGVWMYGDNKRADGFAQKSANHEIKGLNHFMEASNCGLIRFPLMAIIDYRGYRLLAISQLPIDKTTIVYGSCDAGKTVHNSDPLISQEMERISKILNLRGHTVGLSQTFIYGPGDIEVHKGTDGRYYMIDFARIFPPEYPLVFQNQKETIGREIFYQMLRPELVKKSKEPLSSDAFSGWQTSLFEEGLNRDVVRATKLLHTELIKLAVDTLNASEEIDYSPSTHKVFEVLELINTMRALGINTRYLGVIASQLTIRSLKELCMSEVVARVMKRIIRYKLRRIMDITRRPSEEPYKLLIAEAFSLILKQQPEQIAFWSSTAKGSFKQIALTVFPRCLSETDSNPKYDLRQGIDLKVVLLRLNRMLNIKIADSSMNQFLASNDYILGIQDIELVGSTVKYPYIIDFAHGSHLLHHTKKLTRSQDTNHLELERWINRSKDVLFEAVRQMPSSLKVIQKLLVSFHIKVSLINDTMNVTRLLIIGVILHGWSISKEEQIRPSILGLMALYHLHLATIYLFHSNHFDQFINELKVCREQLELALDQDPNCIDEYIYLSLPITTKLTETVIDKQPQSFQKRKVHQLLTLNYLLSNTPPKSIIHKVLPKYLMQVIQIDNFEILQNAESLFGNYVIRNFFLNSLQLRSLSIRKLTFTKEIADAIGHLSKLESLGISDVNYPEDPIFHSFFQIIFEQCHDLKSLTISANKYISDATFENLYHHFKTIECMTLNKTPCVTDITILNLMPHFEKLTHLSISYSKEISDNSICLLLQNVKFEKLSLDHLPLVSDKITTSLIDYQVSTLEHLSLTNCDFTKDSIDNLSRSLSNLKIFEGKNVFTQPHTYKI